MWLDEIEEDLKSRPIPNPRMDRMARVIRDLVAWINATSTIYDTEDEMRRELEAVSDKLSKDTVELLND